MTNAHKSTCGSPYLEDGEVTPSVGKKGTLFTYLVKYFDPDGAKPTIKQVQVVRPGGIQVNFSMTYFGGSYTEGAIYYCNVVLRELGKFKFRFYFENEEGEIVCLPENENEYFIGPTVITKIEHYAVIVCGGTGDDAQDCFERTSDLAYDTFKYLGYDDDHIYYLSRNTDNSKVDEKVTRKSIKNTLIDWLGNRSNEESKCFIYFCDHGGSFGSFFIDENVWVNDFEIADWLQNLRYKTLTIVLDSCFSGQFIDDLSGHNRVVITSTNERLSAYGNLYGYAFFSAPFFMALQNGASYGEAWEKADKSISEILPGENAIPLYLATRENNVRNIMRICDNEYQIPLIDDNGDGVGHGTAAQDTLPLSGDGNLALNTYPAYEHENSKEKNSLKTRLPLMQNLLEKIPIFYRLLKVLF